MYIRALRGYEKAQGLEYILTLDTVNNLGNLYANQGKLVEVEKIYQQVLDRYEEVQGLEYTSILKPVNNLGLLYTNQGKMVEAGKMYQRVLEGYKRLRVLTYLLTKGIRRNLSSLSIEK